MKSANGTFRVECLTLEVSLKPFRSTEEKALREVCARLCDNWRGLARRAGAIAFQLFVGDGDEVFNWKGGMSDAINWCDSTGCSNMPHGYNFVHPQAEEKIGERLPVWTYADLRTLVRCLKETARAELGLEAIVGTVIDSGAEFVESAFKFERHPELMGNGKDLGLDGIFGAFVDATARLREDRTAYAAFPAGIPADGVSFGEFLGKQFRSLGEAVGFDYLWFSNGLGFGYTPWETRGPLFDGKSFRGEAFAAVNEANVSFWRDFDLHSGGMPIGIRGSNTSVGSELSVFGVSVKDALASANVRMPAPNPPWGSLNPGLEFAVYMSRMAGAGGRGYPYRFYYDDTWFHSEPWQGYYGGEPFDILMPLKVAKLDRSGKIEHPSAIHLFSLDDDRGRMREDQVFEVTGGFYRAFRSMPDEAGPLTWVYPFDELNRIAAEEPGRLDEVYFHDAYIRDVVNQGVPINTVIDAADLLALVRKGAGETERAAALDMIAPLRGTVLVLAAPEAGTELSYAVLALVRAGQRVLLYGPLLRCDPQLAKLFGVRFGRELGGDLRLRCGEEVHGYESSSSPLLHHTALTSAGGIAEIAEPDAPVETLLEVSDGGETRAYALFREGGGVSAAWIRGSAGVSVNVPDTDFPEAKLFHGVLAKFGYRMRMGRALPGGRSVVNLLSRRNGAYDVTGHKPDDSTYASYAFPEGAPLFTNAQAIVEDGYATYYLGKSFQYEARFFVRQTEKAVISCTEGQTTSYRYTRNVELRSLKDAELYMLAPTDVPDVAGKLQVRELGGSRVWRPSFDGRGFRVANVTGNIEIFW